MTRQNRIFIFCLILLFFCIHELSGSRKDVRINRVTPNSGSLNGGTKLIIHGRGFSTDFNLEGNTVKLVSSRTVYDCPVHLDGSTEVQLMCYTPQRMMEDTYYIRVAVDGEDVPLQAHCNGYPNSGYCQFTASSSSTPTITQIEPKSQSGLPGLMLKLSGRIFSGIYESNVYSDQMINGITEKILRVYAAGQQCELKGENDTFYGLKIDGIYSTTGYIKCLMKGTYVGNSNASFIVSGPYGRSMLDSKLLRVSSNDQIYSIQTYAEVRGVSPKFGSQQGDTEITISGQYFDETRSAVKVMVGGTECKVSAQITDGVIRCRTAEKLSAPRYSGNRGLIHEQFKGTSYYYSGTLTEIWNLTKNTTGYSSSVIDEFSLYGEVFSQYSSRIHGYFVPPHSGEYTFHIYASYGYNVQQAILYFSMNENPANKVQVASINQISNRLSLQKDKHYYIEALYSDHYGSNQLKVAVRHLQTKIIRSMTGFADQEIQKITVSSAVEGEIQIVTVTNSSGPATNEVQEIIIEETSGSYSDATYQIGLYGVYTKPLQTETDAEVVRAAISELPFFDISESVNVTATNLSSGAPGTVLTITFNSERGDFPDFDVLTMLGSNGENLTVSVRQKVAGVPSGKYFVLTMESKPSPLIAFGASADKVKIALESLFGTRCSSLLTNPEGKNIFYTYEPGLQTNVWGTITNEIEPFCGRYVVKNPYYLYYNNPGIKLSSTGTKFLCFAYQGNRIQITLSYTCNDATGEYYNNVDVVLETNPGWNYYCLDMLAKLKRIQPTVSYFSIRRVDVGSANAFYIDDVYIGQTVPGTDITENINLYRLPAANPKQAKVQYVSVTSPSPGVYEITLVPHQCGINFSLFDRIPGQIRSGGSISVVRKQAASPPISGTFSVTLNNQTVNGISYDMDVTQLKSMIETIDGIGSVTVQRTGQCSNFEITLTFDTFPGDLPKLMIDSTGLSGRKVEAKVYEVQDGGLWYNPIPGDMLRTDHDKPQVMVYVNGIPTVCSGDCTFEWSSANIPTITGVTPTSGAPGTSIVINGTDFGHTAGDVEVTIGGALCIISAINSNSLTCTIGQGSYGTYEIDVSVNGKGRAQHSGGPFTFQYLMNVTMISPTTGALGGGVDLTITGYGFNLEPEITVGGKLCELENSTPTKIFCLLPANNAGAADVFVTVDGISARSPTQYTYNSPVNKPTITGISPTIVGAAGGVTLTIDGTNFGNSGVLKIGSTVVPTDTFNDTQVTATLPPLPPAIHSILLLNGTDGAAVNSTGHIPTIEYQLLITNVFPTQGSIYGGTRITVTGQGFSSNISLTEIKVGSHKCIVESASTTEIICLIQDTASIVKIDNQGVHPNFGKGYQWNPKVAQATVGDIIEWTWTTPSWISSMTHRVEQTANETATIPAVDGFISSQTGTANGKFQYRVTTPGTYSYWSGYTDIYHIVYYRGILVVTEKTSFNGNVRLKVAGQLAKYDINSGVANPVDGSGCPGTTMVTRCLSAPGHTQQTNFQFHFDRCFSPVVTSLSQNQGTTSDKISISGHGFSNTACSNKVTFGDSVCTVSNSTDTLIECYIDPKNFPSIGLMQDVAVRINNLGNALIGISGQSARTFVLKPLITGISPHTSSVNGGASLTIIGTGYQGNKNNINVNVNVNGYDCVIQSVSYTEIVCISPPSGAGNKSIEVTIEVKGLHIPAVCNIHCQLVYEPAETPEITDITPKTFNGSYTTTTITGKRFSNQIDKIEVKIGRVACVPVSVEDTKIICTITNVPVGTHNVEVIITNIGRASNTNNVQVTSSGLIKSVSPNQGSVHGGTELQITGNGFINESTTVTLGGSFCDLVEVTLSKVKCKTRSHVAGTVTVNIVSNGQQYGAYNYEYASSSTPTISSVSPMIGTQGTNITITGSNFGTSSGDNSVTTGSTSCKVTFNSANVIHCTAGAVPVGVTNIVVDVKNKGLSNNDKTFEFELTVSGINKNKGSTSGGQIVTITGSGFDGSTSVTICRQTCVKDLTANQTASQFVCVTPDALGQSACDVVTTVNQVSRTLAGGFTYDQTLTPKITTINPSRGGTGGGTSLTISGSGFGTNATEASVTIAGTACTISTITDNEIVCITGQHTPSQKTSVRVEINGNGIADHTNAEFFYIDVWSSPFTWGGGNPPENGTLVVIPVGNIILLDQNTNRLKMLLIKGGELIFDEKNIELFADNILIVEGGKLQIGTEDKPFQHKAIITGTAHLRTKELPIYGTNSIGVREGILDLHGQPMPIVWTRLAQTAAAGSNKIVVQQDVNWKIGDQIVIASTGHRHSQRENEDHTIASIGSDKKTLTLVKNLSYNHLGVSETISGKTIEYRAEVGLLTRNIVLRGERDPQWTEVIEECPDGFETDDFAVQTCFNGKFGEEMGSNQFGIHVIVHPAEPNNGLAISRVSYVEFIYAGQAFRLGRHPFYFHHGGNMASSYIKGCSFHETFNRAINIHGTHHTLIENNVLYNVMGGAVFLEDGVETKNTIQYNLAVFVHESTSLLNDDITPACFWVTNPDNTIQHNSAAGGSHFGFWYKLLPNAESVCPQKEKMGVFKNNTAHSFGWFGLWIFESYLPKFGGYCVSSTPTPAVFEGLFAWNCEKGAESVNTGSVQLHNFILVNNRVAGYEHKKIIEGEYYTQKGPLFKNGLIIGRSPALSSDEQGCTNAGIVLPYLYRFMVDGTNFANFNENGCVAFTLTSITLPDDGGFVTHTQNLKFTNVGENNIGSFRWRYEGIIKDLDGSLIGIPNGTVVPTSNLLPPSCNHSEKFSHTFTASYCPAGVKFLRFSFNDISPSSYRYKYLVIKNQYGNDIVNYQQNRLTHPNGWMVTLPVNETYGIEFKDAGPTPNMSFSGSLSLFYDNDYVIFSLQTVGKPDCVSVSNGICELVGNGGCVNESLTPVDGTVNYHGDWSYNSSTQRISFIVSKRCRPGRGSSIDSTVNINFKSHRCYYKDCIVPPDPNTQPPTNTRPDRDYDYLTVLIWPNNTFPKEGDCAVIQHNQWIVLDRDLPPLAGLIIYGVLELDHGSGTPYRDFTINVTYILILGGRLIIGWEDRPFMGNVHIVLPGHLFTPKCVLPVNIMDPKIIGVYGGLDLHGKKVAIPWTTLNVTAQKGDKMLTVNADVDWKAGDEIVVAPTGYKPWETETFRIVTISTLNNHSQIYLNDTVKYRHIAYVDNTITLSAEVGLLTRNIKIEGADYPDLYKQSFGGRILVGKNALGTGFARISNVEFYHMGHEGFIETDDPRYAVAFVDSGPVTSLKPSYIRNSAFHHGFSPAIGVYNAPNMPIEDNVIHHSVWFSIQTNSPKTQIKRNMVVLMVWEGSYQDRSERQNIRYNGAISAIEATNLVLTGNRVSGSERLAYHLPLQACDLPSSNWYSDNIARSSLIGTATFPDEVHQTSCNRISGLMVLKCSYYGIYYQNEESVIFEDLILADNQIGIFPMVNGPSATSHEFDNKLVTVKNVQIIGTSSTFDCELDKNDPHDDNIALSSNARPYDGSRRIGVTFGSFTSASNNAPAQSFSGIETYQAIKGLTILKGVTFSRFSSQCSVSDYAIATNKDNDDGIHPIESSGLVFINVNKNNRIFIHRPNLGKINPADCVDMDCDGLKKAFLKDLDGSLMGTPGAVIPNSEFEWNGDPKRGLGDDRVPKSMQTYLNGSRIPMKTLAPVKGVIRDKGCVYVHAWQAYECHKFDYEMLVIESLDSDTETRRLSPVAILGHDDEGDGVIDLINGPQDHGRCSGYICRKRLSTFQAIVATGRDYLIHFTSTTPQKLRFFLLNSDSTQAVLLAVWYSQPYRLDVYVNNAHVMPVNGRWKLGAYILDPPPVNQPSAFKPNVTKDAAGTNWFDRDSGLLYFIVRGQSEVTIKTAELVIISFKYPAQTVTSFYGEKIVEYLAAFFDLPPEKVRVVKIVSAQQSTGRRRKRTTGNDEIIVEIGDTPTANFSGNASNTLTSEKLQKVYAKAVTECQLGNMSAILNATVLGMAIAEPPIDPLDPNFGTITSSDGYRVLVQVDHLGFSPKLVPQYEGAAFPTQPKITAYDISGNRVNELGTSVYPWYVTATIRSGTGSPSAQLLGNTTVKFVEGWANFTNLAITYPGTGYIIDFSITSSSEAENMTLASDPFDIKSRPVTAVIVSSTKNVYEASNMSFVLELRDSLTNETIMDISWRKHTWKVYAAIGKPELYNGTLEGTASTSFNLNSSQASFNSLYLTKLGMTVVKFHVTSTPAEYDFYIEHFVSVNGKGHIGMDPEETSNIVLRIDADYTKVVGKDGKEVKYLSAMFGNWFANNYPQIRLDSISISPGSIIVELIISGSKTDVNTTLFSVFSLISNDLTFIYNGINLKLTNYLIYNGTCFYGVCSTVSPVESTEHSIMYTIIGACVFVCVLCLVIILVIWKCLIYHKSKTLGISYEKYGKK